MQQNLLPHLPFDWEQVIDRHPLTVTSETPVSDGVLLMAQTQGDNAGCLLVIENSTLVGLFTEKDVVRLIARSTDLSNTTIAQVMSRSPVIIITRDLEDPATVINLFQQHPIAYLPVVTEQHQLVGLITFKQLQIHLCSVLQTAGWLSCQGDRSSQTHLHLSQNSVKSVVHPAGLACFQINALLQREIIRRKQVERYFRQSQRCLRLLNTITTQITSGMLVEEVIQSVIQQLSGYFTGLRIVYSTIDGQGKMSVVYCISPSYMPDLTGATHNLNDSPEYLQSLRQLQPMIVQDVTAHPLVIPFQHYLPSEETQALLDIPLRHYQELVGVLSLESSLPHIWNAYEIAMMMEIADYLSIVIQDTYLRQEKQRIETVLQQSQQMNALLATAIAHAGDAIEITNADSIIEYVNPEWEQITGYGAAEAIGRISASLLRSHKHDDTFYQAIENTLSTGQAWRGSLIARCKDGFLCHQEAVISPVFNAGGQIEHYVAVKRDTTERKRVEESLRLTQFSLDHAVDAAFWIQPDGKLLYVNQAACHSLGYTSTELLQLSMQNINSYLADVNWDEWWQCLKQATFLSFEAYHYPQHANPFVVEVTVNYLDFNSNEYGFLFAKDITHRKQAEATLRLQERAINASSNGIVIADASVSDLPIIFANPAFEHITGYAADEVIGQNCRFLQRDEYDQSAIAKLRAAINQQQACTVVLRNYKKDGSLFWNELSITPIFDQDGHLTHYVGFQKDVSDRIQAEAELQTANAEMNALFRAITELIIIFNAEGRYLRIISGSSSLLYLPVEERLGKTVHDFFPAELANYFVQHIRQCLATQQPVHIEYSLCIQNREMWFDARVSPIDENTVIWVIRDITSRKQMEEQLRTSLHEKELLLKEVHHRVKNNLQVISSIFSLQSQYTQDPKILSVLIESQDRIRAMALIHEKLYQSDSLANIDFSDYIQSLIRSLFSSYAVNPSLVHFHLHVAALSLNIDTAIPCGLLVNELLANCLKHAFPDQRAGQITVNFDTNPDGLFCLIIRDNGVGLPPGWDIECSNSLGLRLVKALTRQLNGQFEMISDGGTIACLTFPKPIERKQV